MKTTTTNPTRSLAFFGSLVCCVSAHAQVSLTTIALTGDATPIADTTYDVFDFARINDAGLVSFTAKLAGPSVTEANNHALFKVSNASPSVFRQTGTSVSSISPALIDSVGYPSLSAAGRVLLLSGLYDTSTSTRLGQALLSESGSGISLIAREDTSTLPGYAFPLVALPVADMNGAGHVAFSASVDDPSVLSTPAATGIWTNRSGTLALVAKHGDPAAGLPLGYSIDHLDQPTQNHLGHIAFRTSVTDPVAAPGVYAHAIYRDTGAGLELVAWAAPTRPDIDRLSIQPQIDREDRVVFWHHDRAAPASSDTSLRRFNGAGNITDIVREGDAAPGTTGVFVDIRPTFSMDNFGDVVFIGTVNDPSVEPQMSTGVWVYSNGTLQIVLRENDALSALGPDVFVGSLASATINHTGRVAIVTTLRGTGVERSNATVLLAQDASGAFNAVVRTGDSIDVSGAGDVRTVRSFDFDHRSTTTGHGQFAALGSIAMLVHFETPNALQQLEYSDAVVVADVGCPADVTGDGILNIFDYIAFGSAHALGIASADLDGNNTLNIFDFIVFGTLYGQGCP